MNEEKLRKYIRQMLTEDVDKVDVADETGHPEAKKRTDDKVTFKKGDVVVRGAVGRPSKLAMEAGALASSKKGSVQLMKNLKIGATSFTGDIAGIQSLIDAAVKGTEPMSKAFGRTQKVKSPGGIMGFLVGKGELNPKTGAKFINYTLQGAINARKLTPKDVVQVKVDGTKGLVIYLSAKSDWK